jgi:hypothetical protein
MVCVRRSDQTCGTKEGLERVNSASASRPQRTSMRTLSYPWQNIGECPLPTRCRRRLEVRSEVAWCRSNTGGARSIDTLQPLREM